MPELNEWDSFYVIVGSVAGALIGLQFVMLTLIADHSVALLEVIRSIVDDIDQSAPLPGGPPGGAQVGESDNGSDGDQAAVKTRYQPIPVTVEE